MATRIKRYEAQLEKYDELLARIESEMGPAAELETRRFRRGGFLGMFGGQWMVEIVAILEVNSQPLAKEGQAAPVTPAMEQTERHAIEVPGLDQDVQQPPSTKDTPTPPAGRRRQVDITADDPVTIGALDNPPAAAPLAETGKAVPVGGVRPAVFPRITPAGTSLPTAKPGGAEARITADAQRFARQQAPPVPPAAEPVVPPTTEPAKQAADTTAGIDCGEHPPRIPARNPEITELKESISELRETIKLLAVQQQEALARTAVPAATDPVKPVTPTGTDTGAGEAVLGSLGLASAADARRIVADPLALDHSASLQDAQRRVYDRLLDWNIRSYDALELINNALAEAADGPAPSEEEMLGLIFRDICRNILISEGIHLRSSPPGKVVALVGATGVGKTTTIAKLAAQFAFQNNARVNFVSLDNYRIAAAEQLRTYADIMGLDLNIVFSRDEFDQVLTERRSSDLTLVDTAGRSPTNTKQIYELREVFSAHPPDEVHLVVSASTKADDLRMLLENFEPLSYDHVIISKLDETRSLGCLYNMSKYCKLPISYFTVGQSVPEDIRTANLSFIRTWIEQGRIT